jgi:predicted glycosyltransferase
MRILVYSHDAYGLGNIRRMLAICEHLLQEIPELSILLLSGSPMLQGFRMPKGLDYIKLPCLNRGESGEVAVKFLGMGVEQTVKLRSEMILSAAINFQPDLFLVDKKAFGLKNELTDTINYLHESLPESKLVLLLRDILDSPEITVAEWQKHGYYEALEKFYHQILIVGTSEVFDTATEYKFPPAILEKVRYCGYMRRPAGLKSERCIRRELQILPQEPLILVTPGGGEDGYELVDAYLSALALMPTDNNIKSLIICGPEMPAQQKQLVVKAAGNNPQIIIGEFTDDLMSYIQAANLVVSMAGYNTVCEILSADKPAIILPRCKPSMEQLIRAGNMAYLGLFKSIHPENIDHENLMNEILVQLEQKPQNHYCFNIDMNGLPRVKEYISILLTQTSCERQLSKFYQNPSYIPSLVIGHR